MSSQSLAALRKSASEDLQRLADEHLQHEYDKHFPVIFLNLFADTILSLRQSDRDTLEAAARKVSRHATIGSLVGLGLGVLLAYKIHTTRNAIFNAFRAMEKPTAVQFMDGRTGTNFVPLQCFHRCPRMPLDAISNSKADCNALFQNPYPTLLYIFNQRVLVTLPHTSSFL
jgi:hypothetical protein